MRDRSTPYCLVMPEPPLGDEFGVLIDYYPNPDESPTKSLWAVRQGLTWGEACAIVRTIAPSLPRHAAIDAYEV